jgi:hypothetical protein
MAMMMPPITMPMMMRVSNLDHNLRARCWNHRHEEHKSENSKRNLLHTHGIPPFYSTKLRFRYRSSNSRKQPNSSCLELGQVRHGLQQAKGRLAAMTMVMAVPAMPMMRVSNLYYNLSARCGYQRHEEHKGEKSKH